MLAQGDPSRLFLLSHHAFEVSLHGTFDTVFVLFRVDDGRDLAAIDYALELALERLVKRVLLHEVYDPEAHLLPVCVYDGEQGLVDYVCFRQYQGVVVDANLQDPVYRVPNRQGTPR